MVVTMSTTDVPNNTSESSPESSSPPPSTSISSSSTSFASSSSPTSCSSSCSASSSSSPSLSSASEGSNITSPQLEEERWPFPPVPNLSEGSECDLTRPPGFPPKKKEADLLCVRALFGMVFLVSLLRMGLAKPDPPTLLHLYRYQRRRRRGRRRKRKKRKKKRRSGYTRKGICHSGIMCGLYLLEKLTVGGRVPLTSSRPRSPMT